jgi:hypothetical protein
VVFEKAKVWMQGQAFPLAPDHCERFAFEFEKQLNKQGGANKSVYECGITTFTFSKPKFFGWTTAHAAYRVIFLDGTVIYVDNGAFGGIFGPSDIPSDAKEDFPPTLPPRGSNPTTPAPPTPSPENR